MKKLDPARGYLKAAHSQRMVARASLGAGRPQVASITCSTHRVIRIHEALSHSYCVDNNPPSLPSRPDNIGPSYNIRFYQTHQSNTLTVYLQYRPVSIYKPSAKQQ
jgi:hypothetical protein